MEFDSCGKTIVSWDDEPVFVIRAKDNKSHAALRRIQDLYGFEDVDVIDVFTTWRRANSAACAEPD